MKSFFSQNGRKKLIALIIFAVLLITSITTAILLTTSDNNEEAYTVTNFGTIQGKFTDISINDEDSAIAAIRDASEILGLGNAVEELTANRTDTVDNLTYYRISQNYKGIPVYGSSFVVVADKNGEALCLTGNARDIDENISLTPTATQEQINAAIYSAFEEGGEISIPEISDDMLVIYNLDETKKALLAYRFYVERDGTPYNCVINAENGEAISLASLYYTNDTNIIWFDAKKVESTREIISVDKEGVEYTYSLPAQAWIDPNGNYVDHSSIQHNEFKYKIFITDAEKEGDIEIPEKVRVQLVGKTNVNDIPKRIANTFYNHLFTVEKFFKEIFSRNGFDGRNGDIYAIYNDGLDDGKNGYSYTLTTEGLTKNSTIIAIGHDIDMDIDLIAHEYMHSVEATISNMLYECESGAIMEGYSDIFGELIEDWENDGLDNDCDWKHGKRNIEDPNRDTNAIGMPIYNSQPKVYFGKYWKSTDVKIPNVDNDNGYVHNNSTVISHAAYLMTKKEKGCEALTNQEIAEVWYKTLRLLPKNCGFKQLREYMLLQAELSGFSEKKIARIRLAFDMVGINYQTEGVSENFTVKILCSDDAEYYKNCRIEITKDALIGDKAVYSEIATNVNTEIHLKEDKYTIRIFDKNSDTILFYREFITNNKYTDKNIVFIVENTEIPDETTAPPETTLTPETTQTPETEPAPETTEHIHSYTSTENTASCTQEVKVVHSCICGHSYTEILPMIDHKFVNNVCSMCGHQKAFQSEGLTYELNSDGKSYSVIGIGSCTDTKIVIPSHYQGLAVTKIGDYAFYECKNISSIIFPDTVTEIGTGAFNFCENLTEVVLSENIVNVNDKFGLTKNKYKDSKINYSEYNYGLYLGTSDNPYYLLLFCIQNYSYNASKTFVIHPDTKTIASNAFSYTDYNRIIVPEGIKALSDECFANLMGENVIISIPESVEFYGGNLFNRSVNVKFNCYDNGNYIGPASNPYYLFVSPISESEKSCVIHPNTEIIMSYAFSRHSSIEKVDIGKNVKIIGENAFSYCALLREVNFSDSVISIGASAFSGCNSLIVIKLPDSVTDLGINVFYACKSLREVVFGAGINRIPEYTFSYCYALDSVNIPNNIKEIGENAFFCCTSLKSIEFGTGLKDINLYAFMGSGLTSIKIKNTAKKITIKAPLWAQSAVIYFDGTVSEWNKIGIDNGGIWHYLINVKVVNCNDGVINYN